MITHKVQIAYRGKRMKPNVKSVRNGQTAAIGPPKASSYLARRGNSGSGAVGGRWDIWLIERPFSTLMPWNGAVCTSDYNKVWT